MDKSSDGLILGLFTIFLLGLAAVFGSGMMKSVVPASANLLQSGPPAAGNSVVGGPSISAQKIDAILSSAGSPAAGAGQAFYADSQQYSIDDAVALAFFHHESSYGTAGAAAQTHSIGNIICTDGYSCIGRFRSYDSWRAGIDDWFRLISSSAYVGGGLTTLETIIPKYAPSSENSPSAYIAAVQSDVSTWRAS
jgi:hypothetical protein